MEIIKICDIYTIDYLSNEIKFVSIALRKCIFWIHNQAISGKIRLCYRYNGFSDDIMDIGVSLQCFFYETSGIRRDVKFTTGGCRQISSDARIENVIRSIRATNVCKHYETN